MYAMAQNRMIWIYKEDRLYKTDSLRQALEPERETLRGQRPVISAVGAGGKTTTLHRLADEYAGAGIPVIVTTTTHIMHEDRPYFQEGYSEKTVRETLDRYGQVWLGEPAPGGKLKKLPDEQFGKLLDFPEHIPVLIEADGARRLPLKVPAQHEPVIPVQTTCVLSVYGLDSIGKKIEETVFRPELAEKLLNKKRTECVTAEDIARLAASEHAGRKGCPAHAAYTVVLNKADNEAAQHTALQICRMLAQRDIRRIAVTGRTPEKT